MQRESKGKEELSRLQQRSDQILPIKWQDACQSGGSRTEPMTSRKPLHLKTYLLIAVMVIAGPLGNVLLGKGMKHIRDLTLWPPAELLHTALKIFASPSIWLG